MKMDLICPVYWVEEMLFEDNVRSWIKELPLNNILFGINNSVVDKYIVDLSRKIIKEYGIPVLVQDQTKLRTLGGCLVDLMNHVKTKWFVYVHTDVRIIPYTFEILKHYMKPEIGIIESERLHWKGTISTSQGYEIPFYDYANYHNIDRAFSGLQIIQKEAIQSALNEIEDDFLYRNEDIIFQYKSLMNGYKYKKVLAFHIHQIIEQKWSFPEIEAYQMQYKGLIKYTEPIEHLTKNACFHALRLLKNKKSITLYNAIEVCNKYKKKRWKRLILKKWDEL